MTAPILEATRIVAGYEPGLPIVRGASIAAKAGEITAILGPNGAGKSTLIKAIAGLVLVSSGKITLADADITETPAHQHIRQGLAFVPQTENVFAGMSVEENLKIAVHILPKAARADRLEKTFALFPDLARQRQLLAGRLSGGQRQMLAAARALVVEPRVLMLDEPSAGLSPKFVASVFAKLLEIRQIGVAIVLVEQNVRAALAIADRAYVLVEGENRHEGTARDLANDPNVAALYFGAHTERAA